MDAGGVSLQKAIDETTDMASEIGANQTRDVDCEVVQGGRELVSAAGNIRGPRLHGGSDQAFFADMAVSRLAKRDFRRATVFLCNVPFAAVWSRFLVSVLKRSAAALMSLA